MAQISNSEDLSLSFDVDGGRKALSKTLQPSMDTKKIEKLKSKSVSFKKYLGSYKVKFEKDLDELWAEKDFDGNGFLDETEAKEFVLEVSKIIEIERAQNFKVEKFPELFKKFDEDKNGVMTKGEMSQFIKIVFKKQTPSEDQNMSFTRDSNNLSFDINNPLSKTMPPISKEAQNRKESLKK